MTQEYRAGDAPTDRPSEEDWSERVAALLRLIAYARDEAVLLNADFPAFCLDASLAAAQEEFAKRDSIGEKASLATHPINDFVGTSPLH